MLVVFAMLVVLGKQIRGANPTDKTGCRDSQRALISTMPVLVPQEGFEPPTPSLRMTCSTS
jgi:hypothetical protein